MKTLKIYMFLLFVLMGASIADAQTYYYKLNSYGKNGTENTKVSGGQFITFQAAICMETSRDGMSIGTGYLKRKYDAPNVYVGSANWGPNTKFVFASDKSTLKVYAPDGLIYHCLENGCSQVFFGRTFVDQWLNICFGKYTAASCNWINCIIIFCIFI